MAAVDLGDLDTRVRFERRLPATSMKSGGKGVWEPVKTVYASVVDVMPSRAEKLTEGLTIANRPTRVRIEHRAGISSDMRIAIGALKLPDDPRPAGRRYLKIVAGPAKLGNSDWLEMMAEEWTSEGDA